jgi:phosphate transport system substrate-binding protein
MNTRFAIAAACLILVLTASMRPVTATELRISGAATVSRGIIIPNQAGIEQETGLSLALTTNGDANGLKDLFAGRVDVAMVAAPLKVTEAMVNRDNPGSLSVTDFQVARVGTVSIRFVVNAANPVKSLSEAQLRDILTGKVTSWKEVGGNDTPIIVVAETPGLGTRSNVVESFLGGADITANARTMQALVQVVQVVSQQPGAIGYGNRASITAAVTVIPGIEISQPLGLATNGPPTPDAQKLIAAVAKYGAAVK